MMQTQELITADQQSLQVRHWPSAAPVARVQILHGMAEHCERYQAVAEYLQTQNIEVIAHNHRGHGERIPLGHFADHEGWNLVLADISCAQQVGNQDVPLFLCGHSMGSFVARHWAALHGSKLAGLILSGSNQQPPALFYAARVVARLLSAIQGAQHPSKIMNFLSFGAFNNHFKPNRTEFDWLCSNNAAVDAYLNDPLCGQLSSLQFWQDFMRGLCFVHSQAGLQAIPNIPIYIFGGSDDPVGRMGKGLIELQRKLQHSGHAQVELKLYPKGRHEMLHEHNAAEVMGNVHEFITKHL